MKKRLKKRVGGGSKGRKPPLDGLALSPWERFCFETRNHPEDLLLAVKLWPMGDELRRQNEERLRRLL
jgi:hypothetical protein